MKATAHRLCNAKLRSAVPHIPDLMIKVGNDAEDGSMPTITSYWTPSKEELQDLLDGGSIAVVFLGRSHPPISVRVEP